MASEKVWRVVGKGDYTDAQLRKMIREDKISKDDVVYSSEIKEPIKLRDSIYSLLFRGDKDETI